MLPGRIATGRRIRTLLWVSRGWHEVLLGLAISIRAKSLNHLNQEPSGGWPEVEPVADTKSTR